MTEKARLHVKEWVPDIFFDKHVQISVTNLSHKGMLYAMCKAVFSSA